jgi:cell division protein FtsX
MIDLANINNQFDSKFETFSELVEKIERKYKMFNEENPLMDAIVFSYVDDKVALVFNPEYEIPVQAKAEVEAAYKQVFEKA